MRVKNIIFTRIERDGIPAGPNIEQLSRLNPLFSRFDVKDISFPCYLLEQENAWGIRGSYKNI